MRDNIEQLKRVLIPTPKGNQIPMALVAELKLTRGAPFIKSENSKPNAWVYVDIKTSDIGGFVKKAKQLVKEKIKLPTGYTINWWLSASMTSLTNPCVSKLANERGTFSKGNNRLTVFIVFFSA